MGCIYTAQGFEYDWNGVILGPDLVWRDGRFMTVRDSNRDPDFRNPKTLPDKRFNLLVRYVYKVLLTRGMIGTVIYSTDRETRAALRSLVDFRRGRGSRSMDVQPQDVKTFIADDQASAGRLRGTKLLPWSALRESGSPVSALCAGLLQGCDGPGASWPLADWSWALSFGDHCDGAATMSLANTSRYVQHARTSGQKVSGGMTGVLIPDELESL